MNNEQFRKLILANSSKSNGSSSASPSSRSGPGATPQAALGSRQRSSIPMTPRSVAGHGRTDFARQLAERDQALNPKPDKKFRTSAPKGVRLGEGYVDRARARQDDEEDDGRAERLKALEEALKNEEIDQATYENLRFEIAGGDLSSTHLVKGLDRKLLERVRRGEDVYGSKSSETSPAGLRTAGEDDEEAAEEEENADDAFERIESSEIKTIDKEKREKKGQLAATTLVPGQKRSRDQILAELKAAREAAKAKTESSLGGRFKKIGAQQKAGTRIERDSKGREVLIIVDEDGHERRKVRKLATGDDDRERERAALMPDKDAPVLGMDVPEFYKQQLLEKAREEEEKENDMNIFDDAGSDYDPLAGIASDEEEDEESEEEGEVQGERDEAPDGQVDKHSTNNAMPPPPRPQEGQSKSRNYFQDSKSGLISAEQRTAPSLSDPAVLAALRKAKQISAAEKSEEEAKTAEQEARLKKMLESSARDDEDLDMGFGTNRMADEADLEDTGKVKLSNWGDEDDGEDGEGGRGGKAKRKRGAKKRKGDVNNIGDIMKVMERRKGEQS